MCLLPDADHLAGLQQPLSQRDVLRGGQRIAGRVVVRDDHGRRIAGNRLAEDVARMHDARVRGTVTDPGLARHAVAVVEIEHPEGLLQPACGFLANLVADLAGVPDAGAVRF